MIKSREGLVHTILHFIQMFTSVDSCFFQTYVPYILGVRFLFSLTLPNIWGNTKGKYSPGIYPGITPGMCHLQAPRVMPFTLYFSEE